MSRTERVSKGLVVKQKEQASQLTLPNKSVTKDKLANEVLFGLIPVGAVIPVMPHIAGAFTPGVSGTVVNGLMLCDGAAIPTGNTLSGSVPNLSNDRFLMGDTSSGATGGTNNSTHTHTMAHTHEYAHTHQAPHSHAHNHQHEYVHTHGTNERLTNYDASHTHDMAHAHQWSYQNSSRELYAKNGFSTTSGVFTTERRIMDTAASQSGSGATNSFLDTSSTEINYTSGALHAPSASVVSKVDTDSKLGVITLEHSHSTTSQSTTTTGFQSTATTSPDNALTTSQSDTTTGPVSTPSTGNPSITENRPQYVSCVYVMRVI